MFFSIVTGFAQGFSIPVAQAFGAKDYDELRRNVGNATSLGLLTAAAITAIALLVVTPVLNTMGTPDEVRPMAAATVIAQASSFIFCLFRIKSVEFMRLSREDLMPVRARGLRLMRLGAPISAQNAVIAIGGMIVQTVVNRLCEGALRR